MDFLEENNLLSSNQSGFRSNDSCESQLLSIVIVHGIYSSFDCYPSLEVRGIFLEISKAFYRVWHEGLIYKIQSTGISGTPLKLIKSFLSGRFEHVLLNGQTSSWSPILASVPQGSILGPLIFLIYIHDLVNNLSSTVKLRVLARSFQFGPLGPNWEFQSFGAGGLASYSEGPSWVCSERPQWGSG